MASLTDWKIPLPEGWAGVCAGVILAKNGCRSGFEVQKYSLMSSPLIAAMAVAVLYVHVLLNLLPHADAKTPN